MLSTVRVIALLIAVAALAACQTSSERAEGHLQSAQELVAEDKPLQAIIELRNATQLNEYFTEARIMLADLLLEQQLAGQALQQYRVLVDQDPENLPGLRGVARVSMLAGEFGQAEGAVTSGLAIAPNDQDLRKFDVVIRYRNSLIDEDPAARREAAAEADALRAEVGDDRLLYGVVIDSLSRDGEDLQALEEIEAAMQFDPDNIALYQANLEILLRRGEYVRVEEELRRMLIRFPENTAIKENLIRYYLARNELDKAESFLREQIVEGEKMDAPRLTLVRFLNESGDRDRAREELRRFIDEGTNTSLFRSIRATMDYEDGLRQQAIAEMEEVVANSTPSEQRREIQVLLARMLDETGNEVGARAVIEGVLETDPTSVEALKVLASWKIDDDQTDSAIVDLRTALDQQPDDETVMTIMARAHLLNGERELAGNMLAQAVQASQSGKPESLRYARFLIADGRMLPAESVLIDALRITPSDVDLLGDLASLYVQMEDWPRAEQVERELRGINNRRATVLADDTRLAMLRAQDRSTELQQFLSDLSTEESPNVGAEIALLQAHIERGDTVLARSYLDELLAQRPDDPVLRFLDGALLATMNQHAAALEVYRKLVEEQPGAERVWVEIARSAGALDQDDTARQTINEALENIPQSATLMWMKASLLEEGGDFEGALSIYEDLYDADNSTSVIANNLASLLSTLRDDEESLTRAYQIARRLRDSDFAPFQDTYGWIAYRRGDYEEALRHLEPAAASLRDDALVQYHLARTYQALGRTEEAMQTYRAAVNLAEAQNDRRPQFDIARSELEALAGQ